MTDSNHSLVLVIDDDESIRRLLGIALGRAGFETIEAANGEAGLRIAEREPVSVVVCDLGMPGMSGLDVVAALRERPETATLPILLMTGSGDADTVLRALEAGADDFLGKPVRLDELVARVRAHLRTHAAWTQVVEEELQVRSGIVNALAQLSLSNDPEEAARTVVAELARRTGSNFIGVLQVHGRDLLQPLATYNPAEGIAVGGPLIEAPRARYLLDRAKNGPWSELVKGLEPGEAPNPFWAAKLDLAAGAPIYAGESLVGILVLGLVVSHDSERLPARQATLMAAVIDYASILSVVVGPAIDDRRNAAAWRSSLLEALARRGFYPVYQPIVDLETTEIVGYEALTRFTDGTPPDVRFAEASAAGVGPEYELAAIEAAQRGAATLSADLFLTLNVSPELAMGDGGRLAAQLNASGRRLVLELTEHTEIPDYEAFRRAIQELGPIEIAVDDAGAGFSSLRHILELRPAFAKLDISLVRGIDTDPLRQSLAAGLEYYALRSGCQLIAEGVETVEEAQTLQRLGVDFGQGYLFGRPGPLPG